MDKKVEEQIGKTQGDDRIARNTSSGVQEGYYIGLDIGTDSIGWAATDMQYRLLKSHGKPLWGSYLFDEAKTSETRRMNRTARRRIARVRYRLDLLQSLFAQEMYKTDQTFFIRLNDSALLPEDKDARITTKYLLFGDKGYDDKKYFSQYPTIFHLRKSLMEKPANDIRLLYLACHHIIKNRGHFLFENQDMNAGGNSILRAAFKHISGYLSDADRYDGDAESCFVISLDDEAIKEASTVLRSELGKTDKQKRLMGIFKADKKDKRVSAAVKLMTGGTCSVQDLYGVEIDDIVKIDMSSLDDATFCRLKDATDDGCFLDSIKAVYDWSKLVNILGDDKFISCARVKSYELHRADLKLLKKYVKTYCPQKYKSVFRHDEKQVNYAAYIGMDKHKSFKKASKTDFYKFLTNQVFQDGKEGFKRFLDDEIASGDDSYATASAYGRFERGEFLPKQITSDNGVIPYQLHKAELQKILEKAALVFPFLNNVDEDGKTVAQKIVMLMEFRIPYYVGPLGGGEFAWAVRYDGYERVPVTPWNFDRIIDRDASEEKFIQRMTNKCTYIPTEDVLPANSLLYSEAVFMNELNNIRINGIKDDKVIDLVYAYAHSHKKITKRSICKLLAQNGYDMTNITEQAITGLDGDFKTSLSSYIDLKNILGERVEKLADVCEDIIKWITLMSDKIRLERRIRNKFGAVISDEEIKKLKGLNYSGWGRICKKTLCEITSDKAVGAGGEPRTVLRVMREDKINLSEALNAERWGFAAAIERYNESCAGDGSRGGSAWGVSPSVERAVRRTLALVKEIVKIEGRMPEKIMVETARGGTSDQKGKRTVSRKQQLLELYRSIKCDSELLDAINATEERDFASRKLYAYYMQQCKCMYTGETIELKDLLGDNNVYDFDHIYPQSKINDDSFDNLVLVKKRENSAKTDNYPLSSEIRTRMSEFWRKLNKQGFISDEKYMRLTRSTRLTAKELADFENAQLVTTRQSTKLVANLLKRAFPKTEIVYSKASKAAEFRNSFDVYAEKVGLDEFAFKLVKVRELNDLHHAKDAYINIVVGNVLNTEYGHDAHVLYAKRPIEEMRSDHDIYKRSVKNAWIPQRDIPSVAKVYSCDNCRVVRFVSSGSGELFDATIKKAGANDRLIPLKGKGKISDTSKYGGYDSAKTAYFALVKSKDKKGKTLLSLEAIPLTVDIFSDRDPDAVEKYVRERCGLIDPYIVIRKIRLNTLFIINGSAVYIRGKSDNRITWCNAVELYLNRETTEYLKKVVSFEKKLAEAKKYKKTLVASEVYDGVSCDKNAELYDIFVNKLSSKLYGGTSMGNQKTNLADCRGQFSLMPVEQQCEVLCKILAFMNCNSVGLDLSDFTSPDGKPLGKECGKIKINKFVQDVDIHMINQSPAGHYRIETDLNKYKGNS